MTSADLKHAIRAAQYVRMSTEHQQYSAENQSQVIAEYAASNGMEIVRSYEDLGKSGLTLRHRDGLRELLSDVENCSADFSAILVYDISRWGRFQDTDESAYYEYRCRQANIAVHYCAELFNNDGSISSAILKTLKRAMAAEYSRELSAKVFAGKSRLIELGFRQGGSAGLGFRRMLLGPRGEPKGILQPGDRKGLLTDRVILVPGPEEEVTAVRQIYEWFVGSKMSPSAIARRLNERSLGNEYGRPWSLYMVHNILTNPKYIGTNVSNRKSFKLRKRQTINPPEMWVRRENAFAPLVEADLFGQAQATIKARAHHDSDDALLNRLRSLWARAGTLTGELIDKSPDLPSHAIYSYRFGSLLATYRRIGFTPDENYSYVDENKRLLAIHAGFMARLAEMLREVGAEVRQDPARQLLYVNHEFSVFVVLVRCRHTKHRGDRWFIPNLANSEGDIRLAVRMAPDNQTVLDYYAFPRSVQLSPWFDLGLTNNIFIDVHRFGDLMFLTNLARRRRAQEAV